MPIVEPIRRTLACAAAALLALAAASAESPVESDAQGAVRRLLLAARPDGANAPERLTSRLRAVGPKAVPILLEAIETGMVPGGPLTRRDGSTEDDGFLDPSREEIAIAALSTLGRPGLVGPLSKALSGSTQGHAQAAYLRILGSVGDRRDLPLLFDTLFANGHDGEVVDAAEQGLTSILKRDDSACAGVRSRLHEVPPDLRWSLLRSLASAATRGSLGVLASRLGVDREEDRFILERIAEAGARRPLPVEQWMRDAIRSELLADDPALVAAAAGCLAALVDSDAVSELVDLLGHEDPSVSKSAHAALCSISGVGMLPDRARWRLWLETETKWRETDLDRLASQLEAPEPAVCTRAITELAGHPLHREEIARIVEGRLDHRSTQLRAIACAALGQLRALEGVPFLERCAADADPELSRAAKAALWAIRGTAVAEKAP